MLIGETVENLLLTRKTPFVFAGGRLFTLAAALTVLLEKEAGHVRIGAGTARPARQQFLRLDALAVFPAGAQFLKELLLDAASCQEVILRSAGAVTGATP